jgi:hypothetical protein
MAGYLAGEDVADELLQACRDTPDLLGELAEHRALDRLLAAESEDETVFVAEVRERLETTGDDSFADAVRGRLVTKTRRPRYFLKIAAAILLLLGIATILVRDEPAFATLERVSGEVYVGADSKINPATAGAAFPSGTELFCPPGPNEATVRLIDGSRFTLAAGTRISFAIVHGQHQLILSQGFLRADVEKQPEGRPLIITTPDATVTVLGTRLTLCAAPKSESALMSLISATTLVVDEGRVEIKEAGSGEATFVSSEETAVATANSAMKAEGIGDLKVDHLEITAASFGARTSWVDVTSQLQAHAADSRLISLGLLTNLASNPLPGVIKTLRVDYRIDGQAGSAEFSEVRSQNGTFRTEFILPMPTVADSATVAQDKVSSRTELEYADEVSETDLLHGLTAVTRGWQSGNQATSATLNDGVHGDTFAVESASSVAWTTVGPSGASATYELGLGANGQGWDITRIQSIAAWVNAGFGNQAYIVEIKRQGERGFTVLATVDYEPLPHSKSGLAIDPGATRVTLSADSGVLARGVEAIRFTANRVNNGAYRGAFTFREIDVFGIGTSTQTNGANP